MNCKCGHNDNHHMIISHKECSECIYDECDEIKSEKSWLDKPDRRGVWYWHEWNEGDGYAGVELASKNGECILRPQAKWKYIGPIPDPPSSPMNDAEIAQAARKLIEEAKKYGLKLSIGTFGPNLDGWDNLIKLVERK